MAGEWLKVELATPDKPEVFRISRMLKADRDLILGKLLKLWIWFDRNSVDGSVDGMVSTDVDALVDMPGFISALQSVQWCDFDDENERVWLINFDRHNGESAKKRALKTRRQAKYRKGLEGKDAGEDGAASTKASTREEKKKRRDIPPTPPEGGWQMPDGVDEEAWLEFEQHRKAIRKPLTDQARTKNATILQAYPPEVQRQIVDASIASRWTGLFPPKGQQPAPGSTSRRKELDLSEYGQGGI